MAAKVIPIRKYQADVALVSIADEQVVLDLLAAGARVLVVSEDDDPRRIQRLLDAGADGYLVRGHVPEVDSLLEALRMYDVG